LELLKRVRNGASIERLRERARDEGSPRGYVELCHALVVKGRAVRALAVAQEGVRKFPRSLELADQLRLIWGQTARTELQELEGRAKDRPSPASLRALAEHYISFEELDRALECAQQLSRTYPEVVDGPLLVGCALWKRFVRDHVALDGKRALDQLRDAVAMAPRSAAAWKLLSEIWFYVGAVSHALEAVTKVLEIEPADEDAAALHSTLLGHPSKKVDEEELIRAVDDMDSPWRGYRPEDSRTATPGHLPENDVHRMLHQLSTMAGVRRLALSRIGIDLVARDGHVFPERRTQPDDLVALTAVFRRRVAAGAKRLGIGAFQESEIVLKTATVLAFGGMNAVLLAEVEPGMRSNAVIRACRDVMGRLDVAPREPQHA